MEILEGAGVRIAFDRWGESGDPVVLIHGGWDDRRAWSRVVPGLAGSLQVLAYDRRGHGETTGPPRLAPVREDAEDLARLLEDTELFPAHLVAEGYGAAVALRLAGDRPELVRSAAVHDPPYVGLLSEPADGAGSVAVGQRLEELRASALAGASEEAARRYLETFASPSESWSALDPSGRRSLVANAPAWAEEMGDPEATVPRLQEIHAIGVPVLATVGSATPPAVGRIVDRLAAELPNATVLRLREGGHFLARNAPDLLVAVLGSFLLERNVPST